MKQTLPALVTYHLSTYTMEAIFLDFHNMNRLLCQFESSNLNLPLFFPSPGDPSSVNRGVLVCHRVDHESPPLSLSTSCRCAWTVAGHVADCRCWDCCCRRRDKEQFWIAFVGPVTEHLYVESWVSRKDMRWLWTYSGAPSAETTAEARVTKRRRWRKEAILLSQGVSGYWQLQERRLEHQARVFNPPSVLWKCACVCVGDMVRPLCKPQRERVVGAVHHNMVGSSPSKEKSQNPVVCK